MEIVRVYGRGQHPGIRKRQIRQDNTRLAGKLATMQTDYILEKYLGETAILRYIKHNGYARRDENIMNKKEFIETLALGLDFLTDFHMH